MPIRAFEQHIPLIHPTAFIDETAVIIGEVEIGQDSSIWPYCVIRGDIQRITIGACTSIQDGTIIHVTHDSRFCPGGQPTVIGNDVTVGHKVILHACTIEDYCLIGMGAIVMDKAVVQTRVTIGAGSVVPSGKVLESGYLYIGSPVKPVRRLNEKELEFLEYSAQNYRRLKDRHRG
jgi:carbonic anhydrase/acetyltransferase-like protein (isoleucine patch superfamily)